MEVRIRYEHGSEVIEVPDGPGIDALSEALRRVAKQQWRMSVYRPVVGAEIASQPVRQMAATSASQQS